MSYAHLRDTLFLILAGIFIASLVSCNLIFQKFITLGPFFQTFIAVGPFFQTFIGVGPFDLSVGILAYPVTFLVTDIISELYGKRLADRVVLSGAIASVFVTGLVSLADSIAATEWSPVDDGTFHQVFGLTGGAVLASMTAYLVAQFIDIRLFHFWKRLTGGKHLWLRNNASTIVSQLVDTATVLALLCSFRVLEWDRFGPLLVNGYAFKALVALIDTPLFYLAVWRLKPLVGEVEPR